MIRPSLLSCLGSSVGTSIRLEHGRSWVLIPPEAPHFSENDYLGCVVLCCVVLLCLSKSLIVRVVMCRNSPDIHNSYNDNLHTHT